MLYCTDLRFQNCGSVLLCFNKWHFKFSSFCNALRNMTLDFNCLEVFGNLLTSVLLCSNKWHFKFISFCNALRNKTVDFNRLEVFQNLFFFAPINGILSSAPSVTLFAT
ncbi:hypothetical protein FRX31_032587 [Thalictrum thalictroides]|uniref:Uncharacterized protein n=1 Tax=Thalictrum thalictroides TaxID=46969 RepID=A0A7J6V0N6_THATH|nr:hypothetical protein FRX31_032587 [Thalictrum thalictroides]